MESKDLRIGNWIELSEEGLIRKVRGIDKHGVNVYIPKTTEETWIEIDRFSPIQLTEKMLSKCGFEFKDNAFYSQKNEHGTKLKVMGFDGNYHISLNMFWVIPIKYIHELQNVFYVLMDEEMEINL